MRLRSRKNREKKLLILDASILPDPNERLRTPRDRAIVDRV